MRVRKNALLIFSKAPEPGLVKTRLTHLKDGIFEPEVASALYHCMFFDVVEICCAALAKLEAQSQAAVARADADASASPIAFAGAEPGAGAPTGADAAAAASEEAILDTYELIISTTPPGVTSLPDTAMRTGHMTVAFLQPISAARSVNAAFRDSSSQLPRPSRIGSIACRTCREISGFVLDFLLV